MTIGPVGIAGCGRMGAPMLRALSEAGFDARGYDTRESAAPGLGHVRFTTDPVEFADGLEVLITLVPDAAQTEDVLFGTGALATRAPDLKWIVVSTTVSPRYLRSLRGVVPEHIRLVDAAISGDHIAAQRKALSFVLGGSLGDLDHLHPLFNAMGTEFHRMGPFGSGMVAKVLVTLLTASATAMTRLALDWGDREGLDERALLDLIGASSGQNWLASGFDEISFAREGWAEDNPVGLLARDVASALDAAPQGLETALPGAVETALRELAPRPIPTRRGGRRLTPLRRPAERAPTRWA